VGKPLGKWHLKKLRKRLEEMLQLILGKDVVSMGVG
jgi:hypothetical protein